MFDYVHRNKRLVQALLALFMLPFLFFGVDSYFRRADAVTEVAIVGDSKITLPEFEGAIRDQQDRMRAMMGRNFDPGMFDSAEIRFSILEGLVAQRVLLQKAKKEKLVTSEEQLKQLIMEVPAFQVDGKFSNARYQALLAEQNMSPVMFEARLMQELVAQPLQDSIVLGGFAAGVAVERYLGIVEQQREVSMALLPLEGFMASIKPDDSAIKAHYDATVANYQTPEQVRIEYALLTADNLLGQVSASAEEVRKFYDENQKQYTQDEERQASHILLNLKPDAKDEEKAATRKKAEAILAQVKLAPAKFGELAKKESQDPGSAANGGDLGLFGPGVMVKPFEEAAFGMKIGDIVGPVQSDFGLHIIKLTAIKEKRVRGFEEVKSQIEQDLKRQKAAKKFGEVAEKFTNLVYEQADTLQPVAKELQIEVRTSPFLARPQVQAMAMNNAKFVQAVFAPENIQGKRNTEAIEVGSNALMSARVIEHKPAAARPLEEVRPEVARQLARKLAGDAAAKVGAEKLALLQQGKDAGLKFEKTQTLTRQQRIPGVSEAALQQIFRVDPSKLPAYVGAPSEQGGYGFYRVSAVKGGGAPEATKLKSSGDRLSEQAGRELFSAYIAALKSQAEIKINQKNLEKK
ncbi:MAG: SurA N-terminal domain-containing protein [Betaproteobacteria bacterium]|nr:SurA N-terminal domain-containing protein [Betaproteobacteria bacterium]